MSAMCVGHYLWTHSAFMKNLAPRVRGGLLNGVLQTAAARAELLTNDNPEHVFDEVGTVSIRAILKSK